jgi:hypothetical protein
MSFNDDVASCMSPLPAPTIDGVEEFGEWLHEVFNAFENSGGEAEGLMVTLVAAGAVSGLSEAAFAAVGTATVLSYLAVATGCMVKAAAPDIWHLITDPATPPWLQAQLAMQAQAQGIAMPDPEPEPLP